MKFIVIENNKLTVKVPLNSILYIKQEQRKIIVQTKKDCFEMYATFTEFAKQLDGRFFYPRKKLAINLAEVEKVSHQDRLVHFATGKMVKVGQNNISNVNKAFREFLKAEKKAEKEESHQEFGGYDTLLKKKGIVYKLAMATKYYAFYIDENESDENANTIMVSASDYKVMSDNYFASEALFEHMLKLATRPHLCDDILFVSNDCKYSIEVLKSEINS